MTDVSRSTPLTDGWRISRGSRRFELRNRTREGHERLDAAVGAFATLEEYRRYVGCLAIFRTAMERRTSNVVWPLGWRWHPTEISGPLELDAIDLRLPSAAHARAEIGLSDSSDLLGALYVLEGSTLGACLLRQRAIGLGLHDDFGARHLARLTADPVQWRSFLILLEEAQEFDLERAAAAANAVFQFALRCFEGYHVALS